MPASGCCRFESHPDWSPVAGRLVGGGGAARIRLWRDAARCRPMTPDRKHAGIADLGLLKDSGKVVKLYHLNSRIRAAPDGERHPQQAASRGLDAECRLGGPGHCRRCCSGSRRGGARAPRGVACRAAALQQPASTFARFRRRAIPRQAPANKPSDEAAICLLRALEENCSRQRFRTSAAGCGPRARLPPRHPGQSGDAAPREVARLPAKPRSRLPGPRL